jgi:hypothetical protein
MLFLNKVYIFHSAQQNIVTDFILKDLGSASGGSKYFSFYLAVESAKPAIH